MTKLEEEYHHLSLWYFVSFIFGIIFFFYSNDNYSSHSLLFVLFCLTILVKLFHKKDLLWFFIVACLLIFFSGIFIGHLRVSNIHTNPIDKTIISELSGKIEQVKPTLPKLVRNKIKNQVS
jgi:uncharacterized membrane protein YjjP (DUF1212 family)